MISPPMNEEARQPTITEFLLGLVLVPLRIYAVRRLLLMHLQRQMSIDSGEQEAVTAVLSGEVQLSPQ